MFLRRSVRLLPIVLVSAFAVLAQQEPGGRDAPSLTAPCPECGTIVDIREIKGEREMARLLPERAPPVGPVIRFNFGEGSEAKPHVGAVGSERMREYLTERRYEVTIRFDDQRYGFIELPDASALKVGDRIHVHQGRIEPDDSDLP